MSGLKVNRRGFFAALVGLAIPVPQIEEVDHFAIHKQYILNHDILKAWRNGMGYGIGPTKLDELMAKILFEHAQMRGRRPWLKF